MPDVQNVLYVTTRQWNPGDEFILAGVRTIVTRLGWKPRVEAIVNKSPQVVGKWSHVNPFKMKHANYSTGYLDSFVRTATFDNSFGPDNDINFFDAVIFCGSPGWFGGRLHDLYGKLASFDGSVMFLGIGSSNRDVKLSKSEVDILDRAAIVTCRDERLVAELRERYDVDSSWITCPALLAAPSAAVPEPSAPVALVYTASHTNRGHRVSAEHESRQNAIFSRVIEKYPDAEVVCNYYDEVDTAARLFGRSRVRYTFDAAEYAGLMSAYRFVVSSRVHGCGLASSLGVPNMLLGHDQRAATVRGFGSQVTTDVEEVLSAVERHADSLALREESERLTALKSELLEQYAGAVGVRVGASS